MPPSKLLSRALEAVGLFAVVVIIGGTYLAFGALTPKVTSQKSANVLGARTENTVFYYPVDVSAQPIIDDTVMRVDPDQPNVTTFEYEFNSFMPSEYAIPIIEIRNNNDEAGAIKISPTLSADQTPVEIALEIDGIEIPLIDKNGTYLIPEVTLQPRTITPVVLHIRSTEQLFSPPSLTLTFVQF